MRKETKNFKIETASITDDLNIIDQKTLSVQEHEVETIYQILADNRRDWRYGTIHAPGYFNKKTNFRVGNDNSLFIIDRKLNILKQPENNINELVNDPDDKFLIYPIPCFMLNQNTRLDIKINDSDSSSEIILDYALGELIGRYIANDANKEIIVSDDPFIKNNQITINAFISSFVTSYRNKQNIRSIKLDKNIIINSNPKFIIGILNGYIKNAGFKSFIIKENIVIHSFSTMFNYLGASYSIRNYKNNTKNIWIQLPSIFKNSLDSKFIKSDSYVVKNNIIRISSGREVLEYLDENNSLKQMINSGKYLLIPVKDLSFIKLSKDNNDKMYDLTCERNDATNFCTGFSPIMKNSDGDILGIQGIFTAEALKDVQKFSPSSKEYYRDLNTGDINNWIADDAILGLYSITKNLK